MVLDHSSTMLSRPGPESRDCGPSVPVATGIGHQEPLFTVDMPCNLALVTEEVVDGIGS